MSFDETHKDRVQDEALRALWFESLQLSENTNLSISELEDAHVGSPALVAVWGIPAASACLSFLFFGALSLEHVAGWLFTLFVSVLSAVILWMIRKSEWLLFSMIAIGLSFSAMLIQAIATDQAKGFFLLLVLSMAVLGSSKVYFQKRAEKAFRAKYGPRLPMLLRDVARFHALLRKIDMRFQLCKLHGRTIDFIERDRHLRILSEVRSELSKALTEDRILREHADVRFLADADEAHLLPIESFRVHVEAEDLNAEIREAAEIAEAVHEEMKLYRRDFR